MMNQKYKTNIVVKIDLRDIRAASQRQNDMQNYALTASGLSMDIRSIKENEDSIKDIELSTYAIGIDNSPGKKDAAQIIDFITLTVAPFSGLVGLTHFIVKIIEALRQKMLTTFEIELPGAGKIKISSPNISKNKIELLKSMIYDFQNNVSSTEGDSHKNRIILIKPLDEGK